MYRAGVVPIIEDTYMFGLDRDYLTLMDFGGHYEEKDENLLQTAARELWEESLGLLSIQANQLETYPSIATRSTLTFFVPFPQYTQCNFSSAFAKRIWEVGDSEHCNVLFLNANELASALKHPKRWYPPVYQTIWVFSRELMKKS